MAVFEYIEAYYNQLRINSRNGFKPPAAAQRRAPFYGVARDRIPEVVAQLRAHGLVALTENQDLSPERARKILDAAY